MGLRRVERTWTRLGRENPMWAVLTSREDWDEEAFFATGEAEVDEFFRLLGTLGIPWKLGRALDFGSGLGRLSRALASRFDEVIGVDISEPMVRRAAELNPEREGLRFLVNTGNNLARFEPSSFDLVYSSITLQHMPPRNSIAYLREFARVTRPGGLIAFQLPVASSDAEPISLRRLGLVVFDGISGLVGRGSKRMEMHPVDRGTVVSLFRDHGAELVDDRDDPAAGSGWESRRYIFVKSS